MLDLEDYFPRLSLGSDERREVFLPVRVVRESEGVVDLPELVISQLNSHGIIVPDGKR